ncbi:MAG: microcin ABC transporter ATP-binding protein [Alcaligenaceae bacterium]|nr:MAG: microcin ABC transporter ATP-binding protein [Alcaligenaceae bacterium]
MTAPVLALQGLSISLPRGAERAQAVAQVSLTVKPGEIVCLVGESGSGKSAIAHTVMGLQAQALVPTAGKILLQGEDVLTMSPNRLRQLRCTTMAMIFQEPMTALNPVFSCGEQIDEVLRTHTTLPAAQRKERVLEMIQKVGLPEPQRMLRSYPHQLSGGQRQRIMIAMALILKPLLLIADEPTTALDVTTQAQILALIRALQREHGTGVLFITHDFGVVAEIADRVAVLRRGELVEFGEKQQVLTAPAHSYTKMLIGSVPSMIPRRRVAAALSEAILRTERLVKIYPSTQMPAVKEVTLELRRGETLGIVGESGSGKSTVARCIAKLISTTSGSILQNGQDIAPLSIRQMRPLRQSVQIVFQDPYRSLNPRRTVGASIIEGPMNYGVSQKDAWMRASELMELVRLEPRMLERFPHEFSGGQRQRICIARSLAMKPEVLIADEAVSALDVSVQAQVLALLDEVRDQLNLAMLFITHDLRVAARVCDRLAVMSRGEVVETGLTRDIFLAPSHAYTRTLFEAAPGRDWLFEDGCARLKTSHSTPRLS